MVAIWEVILEMDIMEVMEINMAMSQTANGEETIINLTHCQPKKERLGRRTRIIKRFPKIYGLPNKKR
tara:strand:+ start:321 stop:524 length:204 start_codon:yes stop_codon:yes gene_type:complete